MLLSNEVNTENLIWDKKCRNSEKDAKLPILVNFEDFQELETFLRLARTLDYENFCVSVIGTIN